MDTSQFKNRPDGQRFSFVQDPSGGQPDGNFVKYGAHAYSENQLRRVRDVRPDQPIVLLGSHQPPELTDPPQGLSWDWRRVHEWKVLEYLIYLNSEEIKALQQGINLHVPKADMDELWRHLKGGTRLRKGALPPLVRSKFQLMMAVERLQASGIIVRDDFGVFHVTGTGIRRWLIDKS